MRGSIDLNHRYDPHPAFPALLFVICSICSGCWSRQPAVPAVESTRFAGISDISYDGYVPGINGGRFVTVRSGSGIKTFNTALADDPISTHVTELMNAALVRRNQMTMEWEPWLADKWEISAGETEITFYLREGVRWSDGQPITAADWVFTAKVALTPGINVRMRDKFLFADGRAGFKAVDDTTVKLILPSPYSKAFEIAAVCPLPSHILKPVFESGADRFSTFWGGDADITTLVGSGPFVVSRYSPGTILEMKPNIHYFEHDTAGTRLPYIDTYVIHLVENEEAAVEKLLAGEIDHCVLNPHDAARVASAKDKRAIELYDAGPDSETLLLAFNQNPTGVKPEVLEWMEDKRFRQALSYLVDREWIINNLSAGIGYPSVTFMPPASPYYWKEADRTALRFDPERAAELLDRAGFRDTDGDGIREDRHGNTVVLSIRTNDDNPLRMAICEHYVEETRKTGIEISFMPESFNVIVTRLISSYEWELVLIGFAGEIDPVDQGAIFLSRGSQHVIEPGQLYPRRKWEAYVDAAWNKAATTLEEEAKRAAFELVQRTWIEEVPWVYTYSAAVVHAYRRGWGNIFPRSVDGYGLTAILPRIYKRNPQ